LKPFADELKPLLVNYALHEKVRALNPDLAIFLLARIGGESAFPQLRAIASAAKSDGNEFHYDALSRREACRVTLARMKDAEAEKEIRALLRNGELKPATSTPWSPVSPLIEGIKSASLLGTNMANDLMPLLKDNRVAEDLELSGSGSVRYRVSEFAAMAIIAMYHLDVPLSAPEDKYEVFETQGTEATKLKRLKQASSGKWIDEVRRALDTRKK